MRCRVSGDSEIVMMLQWYSAEVLSGVMGPPETCFYGENPPYGALINFYLKNVPEGEEPSVTLRIRDAEGVTVRTLEEPAGQGIQCPCGSSA